MRADDRMALRELAYVAGGLLLGSLIGLALHRLVGPVGDA